MIKWTTPTIMCHIPSDLIFDYAILTLKQNTYVIEKTVQFEEVQEGCFPVYFTQEETGGFQRNVKVEAQLNLMKDDVRLATRVVDLMISKNLHDEVIE